MQILVRRDGANTTTPRKTRMLKLKTESNTGSDTLTILGQNR